MVRTIIQYHSIHSLVYVLNIFRWIHYKSLWVPKEEYRENFYDITWLCALETSARQKNSHCTNFPDLSYQDIILEKLCRILVILWILNKYQTDFFLSHSNVILNIHFKAF